MQGVSHTPLRGVNTPNFCTTPERERGGREKGERRREEKAPQGLIDTPHVSNPKNTLT